MPASARTLPETAMLTSDELDWLVYAYLEESGYRQTSLSLLAESHLAPAVMDHVVPPGHLVRLLQKALLYLHAEATYRRDPPDRVPRIVGYHIPTSLPLPPLPKHVPPQTTTSAAAVSTGPSGDVHMQDATRTAAATRPNPPPGRRASVSATSASTTAGTDTGSAAAAVASSSKKRKEKSASAVVTAAAAPAATTTTAANLGGGGGGGGAKREREKDDLRPPPAKKTAAAAAVAVAPHSTTAATATSSGATTPNAGKRSASPSVSRKSKPLASSAAAGPSTSTPSSSSAGPVESTSAPAPPPPPPPALSLPHSPSVPPPTVSVGGPNASTPSSALAGPSTTTHTTTLANPGPAAAGTPTPTLPLPPPPPPAPLPNKFRITTTTKTVSTPIIGSGSSSSVSTGGGGQQQSTGTGTGAGQQQQHPVSAAQLAADKRRRGSGEGPSVTPAGGGGGAGDRLLKVKTEAGGGGAMGKAGTAASSSSASRSGPSPTKPPSPLKQFDMRGVCEIKDDDPRVVRLKGHTVAKIQPCAFNSKVPSLLATGGGDSTCRIWDVPPFVPPLAAGIKSPQVVVTEHIVCKHQSAQRRCDITCVAWNPSGSLLATGSEDGIVRIWTPSGDLHLVLSMHQRQVCSLKWNPMGTMLLTSSLDQTVCLWEVSSGKVRQQYATHSDTVLDVDWNDDQTWASASMDKTVHLMSLSRTTPLHRFRGHRDEVNVVKFSPCGTLVASCSDDSTVRVWSLRNIPAVARDIAAKPVKKGDEARRIDRDDDDDAGGGGGGGVFVLEGHESDVHQIAWHPEAGKPSSSGPRLLASCSFDSTAKLWDADAGTCLYTFARASDYVYSIAFEPVTGRYVATGSNDGRLDIYRVEDRTLVTEYKHSGPIYEITWHPHGQQIAVCGQSDIVGVVGFEPSKAA
ncbi:hypothetical protein JCM3774_000093 [Rhodotorula dairenensis]